MQYMMDLIGANIVAGMIIMMIINLNASMMNASVYNSYEVITQENISLMASIIENDLYKIGSKATPPFITIADSNKIEFKGDIDTNGTSEVVKYYTSIDSIPDGEVCKTYYQLNRSTGGNAQGIKFGFTKFNLKYYNSEGREFKQPISSAQRDSIVSIKAIMRVESPTVYKDENQEMPGSYWEKFISPKNLRRLK